MDTVTYAGNHFQKKQPVFAATSRYNPLHCKSRFLIQHISNRCVENIGFTVFCADLRPICADLKTAGADLSAVCANLIVDCAGLTFASADLKKHSAFTIQRGQARGF
ncbi:MAG TPA: hypothetical protein VNV88_05180 [Candidatus Solibacter sp.]|nr:hypothetical protein [Candidatus Solibacter sp.]